MRERDKKGGRTGRREERKEKGMKVEEEEVGKGRGRNWKKEGEEGKREEEGGERMRAGEGRHLDLKMNKECINEQ